MEITLEHIEKRLAELPNDIRRSTSPEEQRTYDEEVQYLLDQRELIAPPTDDTIDMVIQMIAVNWRRTKDPLFMESSFPTYWEAFKHLDNTTLKKAINRFIVECTDKFQPPFGVVQKFVADYVGVKKAKSNTSATDCADCEVGQRYTSVLWRSNNGRYKIRVQYVACSCTAGSQRRRNLGSNHESDMMATIDEWAEGLKGNERIIQSWHTNRTQRELPFVAYPAGNPLIKKQLKEDYEKRRGKTGLGQVYAQRMNDLKSKKRSRNEV